MCGPLLNKNCCCLWEVIAESYPLEKTTSNVQRKKSNCPPFAQQQNVHTLLQCVARIIRYLQREEDEISIFTMCLDISWVGNITQLFTRGTRSFSAEHNGSSFTQEKFWLQVIPCKLWSICTVYFRSCTFNNFLMPSSVRDYWPKKTNFNPLDKTQD